MKKICSVIIICSLFFGAWNLARAEDATKEEEALFVAQKAYEDGFYDVSLGLAERFEKNFPNSSRLSDVQLLIGECYFRQSKYLESLAKFEALLDLPAAKNIKDAVLYWIAEIYFKGNNFDKAAGFYKRIVDEFPKSQYFASSYYSLGWCLFQGGDFRKALEYFKIVEDKYPKENQSLDASLKIIECLYNLKDYELLKENLKNYLKVFSKDPSRMVYLYFYAAEADYYLNNFNDAINGYSKVVANSSDDKIKALSQLGMGWSLLKLKNYKDAESALGALKLESLEKRSQDALVLGKAILMAETNRVNEARKIYDELLNSTSDPLVLMQAYIGKADALYNLADYEQAVNVYKEALAKVDLSTPGEIADKLHYGLAWAYLKHGDFKEAIAEFQKIVKTSDDNIVKVSALCQIGDAYQDSADFALAAKTYDSILKDYPDSSYADYVQYQLGLTLLKSANYDGAILSFLALQRNFPKSKLVGDAYYALGMSYFQRQDYNSSKETFQKFQAEFKESNLRSQALYLLGSSLYNLGNFNEAVEVFKDIIRDYGADRELAQKAEYEIADCFYQMGNEKEAMNRFNALRSKYPDSTLTAEIMWWLGEYYYRHNELEMARRYFSSLIRDFPKSNLVADAYYALGSTYEEESKDEEAIDNFKKVIELGKTDLTGQASIAIADIYVKQNLTDPALKAYETIIKDYPNLVSLVYPKIAGLYYKTGNYNSALEFYRKALDLAPTKDMPGIQMKIAESLDAQGKSDEAIEEYLKATYLYSQDNSFTVKAYLRIAAIYEAKKNLKEAENIYNKIIEMKTEEAKYAKERIEQIKAGAK